MTPDTDLTPDADTDRPVYFHDWDPSGDGEGVILIVLTSASPRVERGSSARTDEGWSSCHCVWELEVDDGMVTCTTYTDGTDCDGRMSTEHRAECPVDQLAVRAIERMPGCPVRLPAWRPAGSSRRDYAAEAAGY